MDQLQSSMATNDAPLQQMLDAIAPQGILLGHRMIASGDELALLPEEFAAFATSVDKVRRASGAARIVARDLLNRFGHHNRAIVKSGSGAPIWPNGIVGSLAHDAEIAMAAIAERRNYASLGVDVEPADPLDPDLLDLIASRTEMLQIHLDPCRGRLLFAVKEAVYKAVYPLDGIFLDHHDVEVNFNRGTAEVLDGRVVHFRYGVGRHIVVLAFISSVPPATPT
jgi:4'-phosphopantetheinyl transferase EntD